MNNLLLIVLAAALNGNIIRPHPTAGEVLVREPLVRLVRSVELPRHCGKGANIEACTAFVGQRLVCQCARAESGWRIDARAQFIPVMYVTGPVWVRHERKHIDDIRERVESHLAAVSLSRFDSWDDCERSAGQEQDGFPALMDGFKMESNDAMHPRLARASSK